MFEPLRTITDSFIHSKIHSRARHCCVNCKMTWWPLLDAPLHLGEGRTADVTCDGHDPCGSVLNRKTQSRGEGRFWRSECRVPGRPTPLAWKEAWVPA